MSGEMELLQALRRHQVPFVVIGGLAVNAHGYARATEDTDVLWLRSPQAEHSLLAALTELDARYIGSDIDPATRLERLYAVTFQYIQATRLMMLVTRHGFLDLFDYVPGLPEADVNVLFESGMELDGNRYASLAWLRQMKQVAGRTKDRLDLENLPPVDS